MTELTEDAKSAVDALAAARSGDKEAFGMLVRPHQRELHVHCYRMTASVHDADDLLQEVLLRAWQRLGQVRDAGSLRAWLYRIATTVCLNALRDAKRAPVLHGLRERDFDGDSDRGMEPYPDQWLLDADVADPAARYGQRESVELAFVAALQHLSPNQRAALILRDVLGFSAKDAATGLQTTPAAVNSALQHARRTVESRVPDRSQQIALHAMGDTQLRSIVAEYTRAMEHGDLDVMLRLLAQDATWSMPPSPKRYRGHDEIAEFLQCGPFLDGWRHIPTRANGQVAVACYRWDGQQQLYHAFALDVLTLRDNRIADITAFLDGVSFDGFGLPEWLPSLAGSAVNP
jgi:RNA polymerase sigma-70 factor, ECF subfamily